MYGENCLIFNWRSSKGDEYSTNGRKNIVVVITHDMVKKAIYKGKLKTEHFELNYSQEKNGLS